MSMPPLPPTAIRCSRLVGELPAIRPAPRGWGAGLQRSRALRGGGRVQCGRKVRPHRAAGSRQRRKHAHHRLENWPAKAAAGRAAAQLADCRILLRFHRRRGNLIEGGNSGEIDPGRLELHYWHAGFPDALEPIRYSAALHAQAEDRLQGTIAEIASLAEKAEPDGFPRTRDERECRHCEYRSYCGRGRSPGGFAEWEMLPVSDEEREEGEGGPWTDELAGGP